MPPVRGLSTALGAKVVSAINAFIISGPFSDEFVAKTRVSELEEEVRRLLQRLEEYRQRVAELVARQQHRAKQRRNSC